MYYYKEHIIDFTALLGNNDKQTGGFNDKCSKISWDIIVPILLLIFIIWNQYSNTIPCLNIFDFRNKKNKKN